MAVLEKTKASSVIHEKLTLFRYMFNRKERYCQLVKIYYFLAKSLYNKNVLLTIDEIKRVYESDFYNTTMFDVDNDGKKKKNRFQETDIADICYVNKLLIRDFEKLFNNSKLHYKIYSRPFSHKFASWTKIFLSVPFLKEFITSYFYVVLEKKA